MKIEVSPVPYEDKTIIQPLTKGGSDRSWSLPARYPRATFEMASASFKNAFSGSLYSSP